MKNNSEYYHKMMENDSEYYRNNDFNLEIAENLYIFALAQKSENKKNYKCKKLSFTHKYFDTIVNKKGKEVRVCKVINEDGIKCSTEYKNVGSSTGNLITHLRDSHEIVSQDDNENVKKPLLIVTDKVYKEKMAEFDPSFIIPGEKKIRTMIFKSYKYNCENLLNLLIQTAENVFLTIDFWSSKAKHRYLGVTATWIMSNFKIKDVMLENKYILSLHSSKVIADELHKYIKAWNLEHHIISITTDNSKNMVSAFPLLNQKDGCRRIKCLPCMAHTLQLAIGKRLALAEVLVARVRRLIQFFQYQKQIEQLEEVQMRLGYTDIDAIIQLQTNLYTSVDQDIKKDRNKLRKILLSDNDKVIPTINEIIFDLANETSSSNNLFLDKDTVFGLNAKEIQPIDFDKEENDPNDLGLMAALLDSHYKSLDFLGNDSEKQQIIQKLRNEFSEIGEPTSEIPINPTPPIPGSLTCSHKEYHQQRQMKRKKKSKLVLAEQVLNKASTYLSLPSALDTEDPLSWWKTHLQKFL
ncbi:8418_t:CDS:2 [Cetraspora pellucida]|uniref:8418_t:CDS:1 n=1 Tax=Cetraspora pellucida TaxID=1433469 RepID=A0ACA9K2W9_9GLOM|nr:8418_t:CDS:2 [Cetraspora pellucida]